MHVFVTGASGFVGAAVVKELLEHGHTVTGLARSSAAAASVEAAGARVLRGSLEDHDSLRRGVAEADGVIHLGFHHDFSRFAESCVLDQQAIEAIGAALAGSQRPLLVTSGVALVSPGQLATEAAGFKPVDAAFPRASEAATAALVARGVRASVVRLAPSVHGMGDHGFVPMLADVARTRGVSAWVGAGGNRWPAVHRFDAARLYRLALELGETGARYHAVAEEGVPFLDIAGAIGAALDLPVRSVAQADAAAHFGWFAGFAGADMPASSDATRQVLGWAPRECGLLEDVRAAGYLQALR
jgi:nucleoside-diphosphate-sugar epimerase